LTCKTGVEEFYDNGKIFRSVNGNARTYIGNRHLKQKLKKF